MNEILLVLILAAYIASGVCQPVLIELLAYNGMCEKNTMLFVLPNYIGMSLSFLMNFRNSCRQGKIQWTTICILSSVDIISQYLNFTGLVNAGSLIFTVIYSSVTVYTAIFSYIFLNRQLHSMQWVAVFLIMIGLIFGGRGAAELGGKDVWLGVIQIFIGSMFHSLTYILSEFLLKNASEPIAPELLSTLMGLGGVIVFGIWQIIYTIPNFQILIIDSIASKNGSINVIIFTVIILTLVNFIHAICFFNLLEIVGSTTTGVLKGVQSVLVFGISHFAFCTFQKSQCFSPEKGISLFIVVIGVILYSSFKIKKKSEEEEYLLSSPSSKTLTVRSSKLRKSLPISHSLGVLEVGEYKPQIDDGDIIYSPALVLFSK